LEDHVGALGTAEELLPLLLGALERRVAAWEREGFAGIRADLVRQLWGVGREIRAKTVHGVVTGVVEGLGDAGELLLRKQGGETEAIASVTAIESGW
jgi:biotin-(acetyl-CoA carboxylase) ligase